MTKPRVLALDVGISKKYEDILNIVNVESTIERSFIIDNVFLDGDRTRVSEGVLAVVLHSYTSLDELEEIITEMKEVNFPVIIYQADTESDRFMINAENLMYNNLFFARAPYELKREIGRLYEEYCKKPIQNV